MWVLCEFGDLKKLLDEWFDAKISTIIGKVNEEIGSAFSVSHFIVDLFGSEKEFG